MIRDSAIACTDPLKSSKFTGTWQGSSTVAPFQIFDYSLSQELIDDRGQKSLRAVGRYEDAAKGRWAWEDKWFAVVVPLTKKIEVHLLYFFSATYPSSSLRTRIILSGRDCYDQGLNCISLILNWGNMTVGTEGLATEGLA